MKYRSGRLGEEIRRIISSLLLRGLKDPRLDGMVSITAVDVTSDCSYASVYITAFGVTEEDTERREEILEAFYSAKGLIRKEIGRQIKLHRVPDLNFKFDTSLEYGRHMEEVITGLNISHDDDNEQE
ncbi:MAG: 30S ribosome-binding factor RbfA [Anaerovoracaceae bacterium]|nr:30S ribosome-binding factor RbfA [Bacillota bacterium]MDY3954918.1 30S ribosome-binding factor RbfA [Anaerovoracaceae bacterium]